MDIYLLDNDYQTVAIVDDYSSLIWRRKYYECGDFELHCPHDMLAAIVAAKYVYRPDRSEIGVIENYGLEYPNAFCKGRFSERILTDFVCHPTQKINAASHSAAVISLISGLTETGVTSDAAFGGSISREITGDELAESVYSILKAAEASISAVHNLSNGSMSFRIWQGTDRTETAIFTHDRDNLISLSYEYNDKEYKNYAYITGQGRGDQRFAEAVDQTNGEPRRILYVDARDLQQGENESNADYRARLRARGAEKLAEYPKVEKCETQVDTLADLVYMTDYDLGDKCLVVDDYHGISCTQRITEIEEVYEGGNFSLNLVFGENYLLLKKYLERKLR